MLVGYCRLKKKRRSTITDLLRMTDTGGVHMEEYRLCNSDYRFMTLVWEHGPIGSGELVRLCAEYLGWKKSTTYTEIKRLSQKGVLKNENAVVTSLVTREEVQAKEPARTAKNFGYEEMLSELEAIVADAETRLAEDEATA